MLTKLSTYPKLQSHFEQIKDKSLREFFGEDPQRSEKFSAQFENIFLDYSKNRINSETLELLLQLVEEAGLRVKIDGMFSGQKINKSEDRAVLHIALRNIENTPINVDSTDVMPDLRIY